MKSVKNFLMWAVVMLLTLSGGNVWAQSNTINTLTMGSGYNGDNWNGNNSFITFVLENNSGGDIIITDIGRWLETVNSNNTVQLWYSSTSLGGAVTLAGPTWTQAATATTGSVSSRGVYSIMPNVNFQMPAGAIYRFALNISGENRYTLGTGTPNNFTVAGVTMYTGNYQFGGNVGYGGGNNPRYFTGYVTYEPAAVPCDDTLTSAVVLGPNQVCPNKDFNLSVGISSGLNISGLTYQWEKSSNGFQWSNYIGTVNPQTGEIKESITTTTWYRCKVTCQATNQKFTTPVHRVDISPFYYCYCDNYVSTDNGTDIGNIRLVNLTSYDTSLNNGNSMPLYNNPDANKVYTNYRDSISWPCLYRDTMYKALITQIHEQSTFVKTWIQAYIDYNHDGLYNPVTEKVFVKELDGLTNPKEVLEVDFTVPSTAKIGPTGMRVVISDTALTQEPCDTLEGGEVEDYIVKICYRPCDGPVNAGLVVSTDTTMCADYEYTLTDTTYEKARSAFDRSWQISGDNITWFNISGSKDKDTLVRTFGGQPLYYRVRAVCPPTGDTTFSDSRLVDVKPGYKCYCYSRAEGGVSYDSSDIGGVTFGGINQYNGGPHLLNPGAVLPRTDYTDLEPAVMYVDSFYKFYVYHTQKTAIHGDAKITVFMDFNNNKLYDIPDERIYTGYTAIGNHTLIDSVQIPRTVIPDVPTGVRVILNNDLAPNVPSDSACGPYVSGETEDFIVIFRKAFPESVNGISKLNGFGIHPNPTSGRFTVRFSATGEVGKVGISVTNVTGQRVYTEEYSTSGTEFSHELNLEGQPAGVYFVELNADGQKLVRKLIVQ